VLLVYVGGRRATIISTGDTEIRALTPMNVAGRADVTVLNGGRGEREGEEECRKGFGGGHGRPSSRELCL
jgi:hypothetical protein